MFEKPAKYFQLWIYYTSLFIREAIFFLHLNVWLCKYKTKKIFTFYKSICIWSAYAFSRILCKHPVLRVGLTVKLVGSLGIMSHLRVNYYIRNSWMCSFKCSVVISKSKDNFFLLLKSLKLQKSSFPVCL